MAGLAFRFVLRNIAGSLRNPPVKFTQVRRVSSTGWRNVQTRRQFHKTCVLDVAGTKVNMPALSPTMTEGTIVKWLKNEGDAIAPGDALCDIQTDKAVMSFEADEEGVLAKIMVPENTKDVKVGTLIALVVEPGEDWKSVEVPSGSGAPAPAASLAPSPPPPPAAAPAASFDFSGTKINMPALSPTMTEGTIVKWLKNEGDELAAGDVLCDIQTDKAVVSFEADEDGILAKILVPEATKDVKVGTLIALVVEPGTDWKNIQVPSSAAAAPAAATPAPASPAPVATKSHSPSEKRNYGPSVYLLLELYGLSASAIQASGPHGKLLKGDVLQYITDKKLQPRPLKAEGPPAAARKDKVTISKAAPGQPVTTTVISTARMPADAKIAVSHAYGTVQCNTRLLDKLCETLSSKKTKVTADDVIVKAAANALYQCPSLNATRTGDQVTIHQLVNIGVAVPTAAGLIYPVLKDASGKGIEEIAKTMEYLTCRTKEGSAAPEELQGATFTLCNLGAFGVSAFNAIVLPPQCGILAVGARRPMLGEDGKPTSKLSATLSYDAAAVGEDVAARFLQIFKENLENPYSMIIGSFKKKAAA